MQNNNQKKKLWEEFKRKSYIIHSGHIPNKGRVIKDSSPIVLWLNSLSKRKQPELFIKLAKLNQDLKCIFVMGGGTPGNPANATKNYVQLLLNEIRKLNNFKYIGEVPFDESPSWYKRASIYVNTSKKSREGYPNAFIQSWLAETPIVSLNVNPDNILTRHNIGFHSKNFNQLVEDVRFLINNSNIRGKMGKEARRFAEKEYDIKRIGDRYEKIIWNAL